MKVLLVYRHQLSPYMDTFNQDLLTSLKKRDIEVNVITIKGGKYSYLRYIRIINKELIINKYDIVHAIYGLSGFVISFQKNTPSVVSFIGSDINYWWVRLICKIFVINRVSATIFVSKRLFEFAGKPLNGNILPLGYDYKKFYPIDKFEARKELNMNPIKKYILFASSFDNPVKNSVLALETIKYLSSDQIELIELKNIVDDKINLLYNACDVVLMTSLSEGSPNAIKEAMACNCPIVSTDVGDVKEVISETAGCYISSFDITDVAEKIKMALEFGQTRGRTNGRERIISLGLDSDAVAKKVIEIYEKVVRKSG